MRKNLSLILIIFLAFALTACNGSKDEKKVIKTISSPGLLQAPKSANSFYKPPSKLPSNKVGQIIWSTPLTNTPKNVSGWKVLYVMEGVEGDPVAASALIYVPKTKVKHDIVLWAHSVTGMADKCAPSRGEFQNDLIPYFDEIISKGHILVAPDYEGLGTPGVHPFLVGDSEAKSLLDAARMALNFKPANAKNEIVVYGHSQGGQAALFAGQIFKDYAPELNVSGVAAIAPVGDLDVVFNKALEDKSLFGYLVMGAVAFENVYSDVDLTKIFSAKVIEDSSVVNKECSDIVLGTYSNQTNDSVIASPSSLEPWPQLFKDNSPGSEKIPVPSLIVQGDKDETVPSSVSKDITENLCAKGSEVKRITYGGQNASHVGVVFIGQQDVLSFMEDRFNKRYFASECG
ncbi:MAG: alpha/beta fold hydrolase [Acidimicrobiia bacterium]